MMTRIQSRQLLTPGATVAILLVAMSALAAPPVNLDAVKAELSANLSLANIKVSRIALSDDATLAPVKETVTGIYDRQEAATKDGIAKLKAAGADATKTADAIKTVNAADDEATAWFAKNPEVKDKISKRGAIINTEIGQIARTPDAYSATLAKVGLAEPSLTKAKTIVKDASQKVGGRTDGDTGGVLPTARTQVREMLSAKQAAALDAAMGGGK